MDFKLIWKEAIPVYVALSIQNLELFCNPYI